MNQAAAIINDTEVKRSPAILALEIGLGLNPAANDYQTNYENRQPSQDLDQALAHFFYGCQAPLVRPLLDRVWTYCNFYQKRESSTDILKSAFYSH
jgi:hypothetical protein